MKFVKVAFVLALCFIVVWLLEIGILGSRNITWLSFAVAILGTGIYLSMKPAFRGQLLKLIMSVFTFTLTFFLWYVTHWQTELSGTEQSRILWTSVVVGLVVSIAYFGLHSWLAKRRKGRNNELGG